MPESTDFVINCYERTYREVLAPGYVAALVRQQQHEFSCVTVLINNVDNSAEARAMGTALVQSGAATRVEFVADHLDRALRMTGLSGRHLKRLCHFTDCCLVAVTIDGPDWLIYWDADARLRQPADWISPLISYMNSHPRVGVGNPNNWHEGLAESEAIHIDGDIAIGYGFSDVAFLVRRSEFSRPIYRKIAPASWRFPLAHIEPIFEQRVDAYMRRSGRLRATWLPSTVTHPLTVGVNYPRSGLLDQARRRLQRIAGHLDRPGVEHPALRTNPDNIRPA